MKQKVRTGKCSGMLKIAMLTGTMFAAACSTVRENGEPNVVTPTEITTDEQRRAIYERGGTYSPQNANPIPTSEQLGLDEKASEINRKKNIEEGSGTNSPANNSMGERARRARTADNDTLPRARPTP